MDKKTIIYHNDNAFCTRSYILSHSMLVLESENIKIVFEGVEYVELSRIHKDFLKISKMDLADRTSLFDQKSYLKEKLMSYWEIESGNGKFCVAGLSLKVLENEEIIIHVLD